MLTPCIMKPWIFKGKVSGKWFSFKANRIYDQGRPTSKQASAPLATPTKETELTSSSAGYGNEGMALCGWPCEPLLNRHPEHIFQACLDTGLCSWPGQWKDWKQSGDHSLQMLLSTANHRITWQCGEEEFLLSLQQKSEFLPGSSTFTSFPQPTSQSWFSKTFLEIGGLVIFRFLFVGLEGVGEVWGL